VNRAGAPDAVPSTSPPDAQRGGLYFLVFDDLHLTPESSPRARGLARDFASKYLGPSDRAAVLSTSARAEAAQEITGDQKSISDAIGRVVGHKVESASVMGYSGAIQVTKRPGETNPGDYLRFDQARAALGTLTRVADVAASFRGERKALVLISSGMDVNISASADADATDAWAFDRAGGNVPREIRDMVRAFIDRANRANLTVYAIDPRGMTQGGESATMLTSTLASQTMLQDEVGQSHASLQALAMATGGQAFVNTGNFDRAFRLIVDANSTYYLLSYSSKGPSDGKFHRIELRTTRPGLTVRARPGFVKTAPIPGSGPTGLGGGPSPIERPDQAATEGSRKG